MKAFKPILPVLLLLLIITSGNAQTQPQVEIYNSSTCPLPSNSISDIMIDHLGNRWFGTFGGGLVKYDGISWTIYTTSNSGIPSNQVSCIDEDNSGNIWIGMRTAQFGSNMGVGWGVAKFDGSTWTTYNKANSNILDNVVNCIKADQTGNIWVGIGLNSPINGLSKFDGSTWTNFQTPITSVLSLDVDNNNDLWVRDIKGFYKFNNGSISNLYSLGANLNTLGALRVDEGNNVWASGMTINGAVFRKYNGSIWEDMSTAIEINSSNLSQNYPIWDIENDMNGNLWFGQAQTGTGRNLTKFDGNVWVNYPYNYITTLAVGNDGIWLGNPDLALRLLKNCLPISGQPQDQVGQVGSNIVFSINTSSQDDTHIWQVNKNSGNGFETIVDGSIYSGATTAALSVGNVQSYMADYEFRCIIDSGTLCNQISDTVVITLGTVGINELAISFPFDIYPNPVNEKLFIRSGIKIKNLELITPMGKIFPLPPNNPVTLENIPTGLYFIRINKQYIGKIVRK
jgi:hypothetical protein